MSYKESGKTGHHYQNSRNNVISHQIKLSTHTDLKYDLLVNFVINTEFIDLINSVIRTMLYFPFLNHLVIPNSSSISRNRNKHMVSIIHPWQNVHFYFLLVIWEIFETNRFYELILHIFFP